MAAARPIAPGRLLHLLSLRRQIQNVQDRHVILMALLIRRRQRHARQRRRWWVKPWIERRVLFGQYDNLMTELQRECQGDFLNYMRMPPETFLELLQRITPRIEKSYRYRQPLDPGLKLAITLRYLATGNSYKTLQYAFRVAHNTISLFIPEVCQAIISEYQDEVFSCPTTPDEWREVARTYADRWNFDHVCGALDGKHVAIRNPPGSGTIYYNYKGFYSLILLALVDGNYKFLWADVGNPGSSSDAQVFNHSPLRRGLENGTLGLPDPEPLPDDDRDTPYFLIGDDAFPLRTWMQKPYSNREQTDEERIFNYRLSRARRVVENSFGILAHRWRCLLSTLQLDPEKARTVIMACMCLHNLMRDRFPGLQNIDVDHEDELGNHIPGAWRNAAVLQDVERVGGGYQANKEGKKLRTYLKHYYNSPVGSLPWQQHMI
ncbi:putative nuclease HARBI1 [Lytechinus variegatus]|uniref:putative nuclease HARBI1 n=1 Tax=Lytechinus variegatus TaxID=7654 RepID=UPI001BB29BA6|nr:putative nuclease HARBI1 [Lytechinus variegatus]